MVTNLDLRRTGTRRGEARNGRGAVVQFGSDDLDGVFTPGELLAVALAACQLMSADAAITRRAGEGVEVTGTVETTKDTPGNRYVGAAVTLRLDGAAGLDDAAWDDLVTVASRMVDRACTVGRTLEGGLPHTLTIERT